MEKRFIGWLHPDLFSHFPPSMGERMESFQFGAIIDKADTHSFADCARSKEVIGHPVKCMPCFIQTVETSSVFFFCQHYVGICWCHILSSLWFYVLNSISLSASGSSHCRFFLLIFTCSGEFLYNHLSIIHCMKSFYPFNFLLLLILLLVSLMIDLCQMHLISAFF